MIPFCKYEGAGNDFILIDDRAALFPDSNVPLIQTLCHRHKGIGADGLILLQNPTQAKAQYRMRIFNSDGSEASMCGNGLRCLVRFIERLQLATPTLTIESAHTLHLCHIQGDTIVTHLGTVKELEWAAALDDSVYYLVNTGEPHLVLFVDNLDAVDVFSKGKYLRFHEKFAPKGANVNFASRLSENNFAIRTYERGVEGETLACGTGSAAVGYVASKLYQTKGPLSLLTRSGDTLTIEIDNSSISVSGPARFIFSGSF